MKYNPQIVAAYFRECGLPVPMFEYRFHPTRKWRFDMAWTWCRVALEVEGGVWTGGRHSRGAGMKADMEKYNAAALMGWTVLRCVPADVCMAETVEMVRQAIKNKSERGHGEGDRRDDADAGGWDELSEDRRQDGSGKEHRAGCIRSSAPGGA